MIKEFQNWLKHRASTIRYKCPYCKIALEAANSDSGNTGTCPECDKIHTIPLNRVERECRRASEKAIKKHEREKLISERDESHRKAELARQACDCVRREAEHKARFCIPLICPYCGNRAMGEKLSNGEHWVCSKCGGRYGGDGGGGDAAGGAMAGAFLGTMIFGHH